MKSTIYFDNSASTPLDPRVAKAMNRYGQEHYGNPSSLHQIGRQAHETLQQARRQVARLIQADPHEIIFTSSGTEADNLALIGVFESFPGPFHLITCAIEHPAILETCHYLERRGAKVTYLGVDQFGVINPDELEAAFTPNTRLVSLMAANNVIGTIQPLNQLIQITKKHGALFHTDAVQAYGKIPLDVGVQSIDLLSISSHKIYGPTGVGALFVRKGIEIKPLLHGGGQEFGTRSSTENILGIVGFGIAAEITAAEMAEEAARLVQMREKIITEVTATIPNAYLIGHPHLRLPGHIALGFSGQEGEAIKLLLYLDQAGIAISSGSACSSSHASEPSYVLRALGFDPFQARGGLRISLGRFNTADEVDRFLKILPQAVAEMRPVTTRVII